MALINDNVNWVKTDKEGIPVTKVLEELTWANKPAASKFGKGQAWFSDIGAMGYSDGSEWSYEGMISPIDVGLNSVIWRYPLSGTEPLDNSYWVYVPVNADGDFAYFGIGKFIGAGAFAPNMSRFGVGRIGTELLHSAGTGVTKVGTWSSSSPAGAYIANVGSATAGEYVEFTIKGHTIVSRFASTTLGGLGVVSIDGDFTLANRLPTFTAADFASGKCRSSDVGKRYIDSYSSTIFPDLHLTIADNLTDATHIVRFEATGTRHPSSGAPGKLYLRSIIGCSSSDASKAVGSAGRVVAHIIPINDIRGAGASTLIFTPEIEKTVATGTYEFLGHGHGGETAESLEITVDTVSQTAMAAGAYASGKSINIYAVSTLASTDDPTVPVCRKKINMFFGSRNTTDHMVLDLRAEWLVNKVCRYHYPMQLQIGTGIVGAQKRNVWWDSCSFGNYASISSDFSADDGAQHGNNLALSVIISGSTHNFSAEARFLDAGIAMNHFMRSAPDGVFLQDRADGFDKIYFARSTSNNLESFLVGDVCTSRVGFKIRS